MMTNSLQIYRVGGYIRDKLLGLNPHDCDYVVVGSTAEEMLKRGFIQVGRAFPVFLHPKTREEYALARCEKKISHGHTGFLVHAHPSVTLEEDLKRRDITINAIAESFDGELIDPYGGLQDLHNHIIRHVSEAFTEDPLRILRIARFVAKLNFSVAPETKSLIQEMALKNDIYTISRERIIEELTKALEYTNSHLFFITLRDVNCLDKFFPSIAKIMENHNSWQKLISLMQEACDAQTKLFYLGMLYHENSLNNNFYEFTNSNKVIDIINKSITLNTLDITQQTELDILGKFKQLDIWRNYARFEEIFYYLTLYTLKSGISVDKIKLSAQLASILHAVDLKPIITISDKQNIAMQIKQHYVTIINKFQLGTINHD